MRIAIVGYGKIGTLYEGICRANGHRVLTVDPRIAGASFASIGAIPKRISDKICVWLVCTPTETHVAIAAEILDRAPSARILIEKPACVPNEIARLKSLTILHPHAVLAVSDTYGNSPVLRSFLQVVRERLASEQVVEMTIELSKNRARDERLGRFVDRAYGDAGYEGFHVLSIERLLRTTLRESIRDGVDVRRFTSVRGEIGYDVGISECYSSLSARAIVDARRIPAHSEFRYRIVQLKTSTGRSWTLVFEPYFGDSSVDFKNTHVIAEGEGDQLSSRIVVRSNQLEASLRAQLESLARGQGNLTEDVLACHDEISSITTTMMTRGKVASL